MIAMDNQPSMVEDRGFIELLPELEPRYVIPSTKYFNETMLPQTYDNLKLKMTKELFHASSWSLTSYVKEKDFVIIMLKILVKLILLKNTLLLFINLYCIYTTSSLNLQALTTKIF